MSNPDTKPPMTEEEQKFFEKYGRLPKPSVQLLQKKEKKYFDSADWAKGQSDAKEVKQPSEKPIKE
ncbi:hypothetical protein DICPUDRAFT_157807 [Dictyostelium purpureum]|uniref:Uncharacterized protein n=1 Tax=Dictyostelium purpureum TaxID=5786 RepID=F1A021_DICPU|nr:uncharacterized protein DICPUDRAFT_157807 [Dictyostelium purpureum]EGC30458.1 hypothetical protein DICPUDRAFT_157807 [Dictyostelium purpureum]|eukprot:XP_003293013.1 hypothetical protein DICPUDRAFT_157807 [Dictyostelium purpureum]